MTERTRIIGDKDQRSGVIAAGGTAIGTRLIVTRSGTTEPNEVALATAATVAFLGVTTSAITPTATQAGYGNVQVAGKTIVIAGGTVTAGQRVTADGNGNAVTAAAGNAVLGVANHSALVTEDLEVELAGPSGQEMP